MNLMRALAATLLLASSLAPAAAQPSPRTPPLAAEGDGWVGYIVPPYPSGWSEDSGSCIGSVDDEGGPCHHSIAVIRDAQSGMRMILALESMDHFGKEPLWRIVAALEPDALFDHDLAVAHGSCQLRGVDDGAVVAIVHHDEREWLAAREAWHFDRAAGRLVPLRGADVRCRNEGGGYDG
jgi:hypothetical protein